jgi:small subunit ribosomal protein S6e
LKVLIQESYLGITTVKRARSLGPKRVSHIRKLYQLEKTDDVRKYVVKRTVKKGKKSPKIQRLVTSERVRRKKVIQVRFCPHFNRKSRLKDSPHQRRQSLITRS